jgi:hypothetical protein
MPLVAPKIVGNLSILSSKVRVRNQLPGAILTVYQGGVALSPTFVASAGDQVFDFGARPFLAGRDITVRQQVGSEISADGPATRVQSAPLGVTLSAEFARGVDHVICAKVMAITGGVSGTTVRIESRVGTNAWALKGSAEILDTEWTPVPLTTAIVPAELFRLTVVAPVPGYSSRIVLGPASLPLATPSKAPTIVPDVRSCQTSIFLENCVLGSQLEFFRGGTSVGSVQTKFSRQWITLPGGAVTTGEQLEVRQSFPTCQTTPVSSGTATVIAGPLLPPLLYGPICANATSVHVSGLVKDARVRVWVGGVIWAEGTAASETDDLFLPAIPASSNVYVTQGLCSPVAWSAPSNTVTSGATSGALPVPAIPGSLYECGGVVRVDNLEIGSTVKVYSGQLKGELGAIVGVQSTSVDVPVAPTLLSGDKVYAIAYGCSATPARTAMPDAIVQAAPAMPQPGFSEPPEISTNYVKVKDILPGATVEVLVGNQRVALERVGANTATIEFDRLLAQDSQVEIRQSLCDLSNYGTRSAVAVPFAAWKIVVNNAQIMAVHSALLPNGKVLYFGGSQHNWRPAPRKTFDATRLYDPETDAVTVLPSPGFDLFCCGHAMLADGRLLVAGGTALTPRERPEGGWLGLSNTAAFDWTTNAWQALNPMAKARWYPTLATLADGRVLAGGDAARWEVYTVSTNSWATLPYPVSDAGLNYPRVASMPGGKVLCLTGETRPFLLDLASSAITYLPNHPGGVDYRNGINYGLVVLPYSSSNAGPNVLTVGYDRPGGDTILPFAPTAWQPTGVLAKRQRTDCCTVLLPDGSLLVTGGTAPDNNRAENTNVNATFMAESYDPTTRAWTPLESTAVVRRYHSCTLLLVDGRVLSLGSNFNPNHHNEDPPANPAPFNQANSSGIYHGVEGDPATDANEYRIETFRPPYLRVGRRPSTSYAPSVAARGGSLGVATPDAGRVAKVRLMRLGSFTHALGTDQRSIELDIVARAAGILYVSGPPSGDYAPPGYYMIFLQSTSGAVSRGRMVRVP